MASIAGLFAIQTGLLLGCPLYDDECDRSDDCANGFSCDRFSQRCAPIITGPECTRPEHCADAETCTPDFLCRAGSCDFHGCVEGYSCGVADSAHACLMSSSDASAPNASLPDAALPSDAAVAEPVDAAGVTDAASALDGGPDASDAGL